MDKSLLRFIGVGLVGYIVWYSLYQYWLKDHTLLDEYLIHGMVLTCEWVQRGVGFALSNEISLKFKELCQEMIEPFSSAEVMHGPKSLIQNSFKLLVNDTYYLIS